MKKKITVISCVIFVAAMMMFAQPAMSGKWADTPSGLDVQILYVTQVPADQNSDYDWKLIIVGYNFVNGAEPIVKLGDIPCDLLDIDPLEDLHEGKTLWTITVGITIPPIPIEFFLINSLVTLQTGPSVHQFDSFNIMLFPFGV